MSLQNLPHSLQRSGLVKWYILPTLAIYCTRGLGIDGVFEKDQRIIDEVFDEIFWASATEMDNFNNTSAPQYLKDSKNERLGLLHSTP